MGCKRLVLLLVLLTVNDIFCIMPQTVVSNIKMFVEGLNTNLNVVPPPGKATSPVFVITVTRISDGKARKIQQEELDNVLNCLSNLCTERDFTNTHRGQLSFGIPPGIPPFEDSLRMQVRRINKDNVIKACAKIIIFNEMFFSQDEPLQFLEKRAIESSLCDLSKQDSLLLLCPNFLFLGEVKTVMAREMRTIIDKTMDSIQNEAMQMDDPYDSIFAQKISDTLSSTETSFNITPLINKSICIHNGATLMEYMKSTYFQESDRDLVDDSKKCWYFFGDGDDHLVIDNKLSNFLLQNASFEICFDLANGIREKQNKDSKLHILQSNWIDSTDY